MLNNNEQQIMAQLLGAQQPAFPSTDPTGLMMQQQQDQESLKQQQLMALMQAAEALMGQQMLPQQGMIPSDAMSAEGADAGSLENGSVRPTPNGLSGLM